MPPLNHPQSRTAASAVPEQLLALLEEWRRLTECESDAIQRNDWAGVAEQQQLKKSLRESITRVQQRQAPPAAQGGLDQRFQALLGEVVALERRNGEILSAKRQQRQEELLRLHQANRQLQGVRRAYGSTSESWWQSYS